ncbi:MAG: isoprenylcysteine carboxylmethyltransferase family protein, partial [Anaerolineales bacterium]|nr:isoprenylcysteine carboxylmethyltransferase family protein [Anaerolineales bacterium]
ERAPWLALNLPPWLRWWGVAGGTLALAMLLWAHHSLGPNFSPNVDLRPEHQLIRQGIYRWVRHPIYVAYALLFLCAALISGNWMVGVSGLGIIVPLMTVRLRREELLLRQHFGQAYADYVHTTPRFLPAVWLRCRG